MISPITLSSTVTTLNTPYMSSVQQNSDCDHEHKSSEDTPLKKTLKNLFHTAFSLEGFLLGVWFLHIGAKWGADRFHSQSPLFKIGGALGGIIVGSIVHEIIENTKDFLQDKLDQNVNNNLLHGLGQFFVNAINAILVSTVILGKKIGSLTSAKHDPDFNEKYIKLINWGENWYIKLLKKLGLKNAAQVQAKSPEKILDVLEQKNQQAKALKTLEANTPQLSKLQRFTIQGLNHVYHGSTSLFSFPVFNKEGKFFNKASGGEIGKKLLILSALGLTGEYMLDIAHSLIEKIYCTLK